jgi:hypothetical protein
MERSDANYAALSRDFEGKGEFTDSRILSIGEAMLFKIGLEGRLTGTGSRHRREDICRSEQ